MQCSVRSSNLATVPYSMKNLIACFQVVLCLRNRILLDYCVSTVQEKRVFFCSSALNFIVLSLVCHALISAFNLPGTNFSIQSARP